MTDLFARTGLEQDTGTLRERWGQDGNDVVNQATSKSASGTLRTVTSGKVLYIKTIMISNEGGLAGQFGLRDGGAAGSQKMKMRTDAVVGSSTSIFYETPLKFETDIYFEENAAVDLIINLSGWEEAA